MKKKELIQDIEYLLAELPKKHKNLYGIISSDRFNEICNSAIEEVRSKGYKKKFFEMTLLKIFATIKEPHTTIYTSSSKTPVFFEYVSGSYYPFVINKKHRGYLGRKLLAVDDIPINKFISLAEEYLVFDNEEQKKIKISRALKDSQIIKYLSQATDKRIKYSFEKGEDLFIRPLPAGKSVWQTSIYRIKGNEWLGRRDNYSVEIKGSSLYLRYSRCEKDPKYSIPSLVKDIENILKGNPKSIIVDLRGNQGGSSIIFNPIIKVFAKYIEENRPKVFCLINRPVFSSGVLNTYDMKYKLGAKLVGQPTSQGVNHYGEIEYITLPNSKIEVQYSSKYFKLIDDDSKTIQPDVYIEPTIEDYMSGNDVVLNYCLK